MATHRKRGDTYHITVSLGYNLAGKQIRKYTTWTPPADMTPKQIEKELERQKVLFEERCRSGQVLDGNIRFAEFAEIWFEKYAEKQLKAKTLARYKGLINRINSAIGHIRLDKLQPLHLQDFYSNLGEAGVREDGKYSCSVDFKKMLNERGVTKAKLAQSASVSIAVLNSITQGKNINCASVQKIAAALGVPVESIFTPLAPKKCLSTRTIQQHHRLISIMLNTAIQWQMIFNNPCDRVKTPKVERKPPKHLDDEQSIHLMDLLEHENPKYRSMITLLLYTGLRRGELCGLEWQDIDFSNSIIHVRRESLYLPDRGIFVEDGKSESSVRSIKASQSTMTLLREHKAWQNQERLKLGDRWKNSDRLFTTLAGAPIFPDTISGWLRKFVDKNNLDPVNIHGLRHTNASLLIASGTPITTVSKRLGHANTAVTGQIYAHAIRTADEVAADKIEDFFSTARSKTKESDVAK